MRILITGCAGFIGSHLAETLITNGYIILGIDNLNDYYDPKIKENNIKLLYEKAYNYDNFQFIKDDIRTTKHILEWKPDMVIHLAAMAGVRYSLQNPSLYSDVNVTGFINIIEQCRIINCRLIYASSSSVYGLNKKIPFSETDSIDTCNSPYAATKRAKEIIAQTYSQIYSMETIGLRFFTVYGPRGRPDMAPYKFLTSIMNNKSIDKYGNINEYDITKRDYTYVTDIIDGIISTIKVQMKNKYEIYNLGNNYPIELNSFINTIENVTNKKAIINQLPMQQGDVPITYADITKAQNELNYNPKIDLETGIRNMFIDINLKKNQ